MSEQRQAVEHGVGGGALFSAPLLIIAGAGSGKTNTLAHRVAHLIVHGADPRRILLMTFSRRAAGELTSRVKRICGEALGEKAGVLTDALAWAGTFHGVGARLLREHAEQIGLDENFTIHDREDSADLMNLARHDLGFSKTESRFPAKGTCLAIYSRAVNSRGAARRGFGQKLFRGARAGARNCGRFSPPMSKPSRRRTCSITTTCCSTGRKWSLTRNSPARSAENSIRFWSMNIRTPTAFRPRS